MFAVILNVSKVAAKFQILRFCLEKIAPVATLSHDGAKVHEALYCPRKDSTKNYMSHCALDP
jgi:hypothetical protein